MPTLIGTGSNQVPTNGDLGTMAFQDSAAISVGIATVSGLAVSGTANISGNTIIAGGLTSANLTTGTLYLGNSTVNSIHNSVTLSFFRTNGANNAGVDLSTTTSGAAYLELGGSSGSYIDFKVPFSDDYDQRIEANNSSISIIGGSATSAANNILLSSANVGIGTTTPDARLAVSGTANISGNMTIGGSLITTNVVTIGTSTYFVSNGNVGIGTNNPTTKLDIAGPIRSYNSKFANGATGTNLILRTNYVVGEMAALSFYSTFASGGDPAPRRSSDITSGYSTGAWGNEYLSFNVGTGGVNDNANTTIERMRITGVGNVGIGNTNPDAKLAVTGTANVSGNVVIGGTLTTQSFVANTLGLYNTGTINAASFTIGTSTIANSTGVYTDVVNGSTLSVGTSVTANSTRLVIGTAVGLQANGGIGTANQALFSNGTSVYWANVVGGATITANNTDTQTFYIPMSNATSGSWSNGVVSNTKLYFVPSTGTLNATIFNSLSDREQKINIVTAPVGFIDAIRGVEYNWKDNGKKSSGVIAQEIEEYLPHLVETKDGSKSVNYSGLIAYLIEEIKQLKDRVKALENK